jgi:UDP-glucose 4-epimerase
MTKPLAMVTGATGAVGPTLVEHLLRDGYAVRTLSRKAPAAGLLPQAAQHISADINDETALRDALAGVDVVFHLAALLHIENPGPELAADYRRVNVDGARRVAELAAQADVRRFVYFSTVKVYGCHQRTPVTEDQTPAPQTLYAQTKLAGEQAVQASNPLEVVVLRLSAVYGPRLRGSWARLVRAIRAERFIPVGNLRNVHSLTHVADVARAALLVAQHQAAAGRAFNVVGHESPTMQAILSAIYATYEKKLPAVRVPASAMLLAAFSLEKVLALGQRRSPLSVQALRQLIDDEAYSAAALNGLGFAPHTLLTEGWRIQDDE